MQDHKSRILLRSFSAVFLSSFFAAFVTSALVWVLVSFELMPASGGESGIEHSTELNAIFVIGFNFVYGGVSGLLVSAILILARKSVFPVTETRLIFYIAVGFGFAQTLVHTCIGLLARLLNPGAAWFLFSARVFLRSSILAFVLGTITGLIAILVVRSLLERNLS